MKLYRVHLSTKWNQTHDLLQRYRLYTNIVGKYFRKNCTSFENRKKGEELCCPVSQRVYVYCVYPVMLKAPKQLSNCLKRTEKSIVLIVLIVSYEVRAYTATVVQHESGTRKVKQWNWFLNPRSTTLEASKRTITPHMRSKIL
jgi:hypothetical protein